jgi:hypothetical protein
MKYKYKYAIYTNNLCWGKMKIAEYDNMTTAELMKNNYYINKYGCCDIVKKRYYL